MNDVNVFTTPIPGLLVVDLAVHGDHRGWFKENWQREKMHALGLPDFHPVQNNVSFNRDKGTTRGIHAEPWDKFVSVATGRVFGAWVDLRDGAGFGQTHYFEIGPNRAVFVPRGVGNAYQTLEPDTAYTYLVNAHWNATAQYTFLNLGDARANIPWPVPLDQTQRSNKDLSHPMMDSVVPFSRLTPLILGSDGQLGTALREQFPQGTFYTRDHLDLTDLESINSLNLTNFSAVINAAAFTAVDLAESSEGRATAWAINASAPAALAAKCAQSNTPFVHISSDYVFDGTSNTPYAENAPFSPVNVYGQSKAAGDLAVQSHPLHYLLRTSWVIGKGNNFVDTMRNLALGGVSPNVVNDQYGRLTFTSTIASAISHLLRTDAPYGTYNCTNSGEIVSWADIAAEIFRLEGADPNRIKPVSTAEYQTTHGRATARPAMSGLALDHLRDTGFSPSSWELELKRRLA